MKFEIILRIQETRYSSKVDQYRCVVPENRRDSVIKQYEEHRPNNVYGSWVLVNELDDEGNFVQVYL